MSSIIKGERIRNQSIINLSERFKAIHIEYEKDDVSDENSLDDVYCHDHSEATNLVEGLGEEGESDEKLDMALVESHKKGEEILQEAHQTAYQIVEEAKQRAEEILSAALVKSEELKDEARVKQTQLLSDTKVKTDELLAQANEEARLIQAQAEEEKKLMIKSSEFEVVSILQTLLSHIISEELFQNVQWLTCMVRKMLQECHTKEAIKICVAQDVFEALTENQKEEIKVLGEKVTLEVRNTLNETTCVVETKEGDIVYDIKDGLERVLSEIRTLEKLS